MKRPGSSETTTTTSSMSPHRTHPRDDSSMVSSTVTAAGARGSIDASRSIDVRNRVELRISQEYDGTVVVAGDLDAQSADVLDRLLQPLTSASPSDRDRSGDVAGGSTVVIDVRGVEFMDSSGLRTLVAASLRAGRRGGRVVLRNVGPRLWRLLEITGLNDHFAVQRTDSRTGERTNGSVADRSFHR